LKGTETQNTFHASRPAGHGQRIARRVLIVAGEDSGDKHAAKLVRELRVLDPRIEIYAAGGEKMAAAGATILHNLVEMAVLGSVEVLKNYFRLRRVFYDLLAFVAEKECDAVILVDFPGFNIRFAKKIRKRALPVKIIYYISPQLWAWGARRKKTLNRIIDTMIVILPFENKFYADCGFPVEFVGHPMLDDLRVTASPEEFRTRLGLRQGVPLVAVLPGSRWNEVRRHLPVMLVAARLIKKERPEIEFAMLEPKQAFRSFTEGVLKQSPVEVRVVGGNIYDLVNASEMVIVASGTATLETACLLKPMLIIYRVAWPTYFLGRLLVKLPYIGMVNVLAGRKVVPEFIQHHAKPEGIASAALSLLDDREKYADAVERLKEVRTSIGEAGASERAAKAVLRALEE
jgi:lipid-A-disaccharide synthase